MAPRPKGYIHGWEPPAHIAHWLAAVDQVLTEYASYGPMTVRQVFYRLVGQHDYDKTEKAYNNLANWLVKARRAGMVPFHAIRDDGTVSEGGGGYSSGESFWRSVKASAEWFELDRQLEQDVEIELWCEAAGMAPMLAGMLDRWSIPVYSTGGFASVTVTYEVAQRIMRGDRPTVFLHVGDYDPSGESIYQSMVEDIGAFVRGHGSGELFEPTRVALTADQAIEYDLPTAPPKGSDSRSARWAEDDPVGGTVQAEAMPPDLLETIVTGAVESLIDQDILDRILEREQRDKDSIEEVLEGLL